MAGIKKFIRPSGSVVVRLERSRIFAFVVHFFNGRRAFFVFDGVVVMFSLTLSYDTRLSLARGMYHEYTREERQTKKGARQKEQKGARCIHGMSEFHMQNPKQLHQKTRKPSTQPT